MSVKWDKKRLYNGHGYAKENDVPIAFTVAGHGSWSWPTVIALTGERKGQKVSANWILWNSHAPTPAHHVKDRLHHQPGEIGFHTWEDLVLWTSKHLRIDGWDNLTATDDWVPAQGSTARPCEESMTLNPGRGSSITVCGRPVKENGRCGQHLAVARKRKQKDDEYREWNERTDAAHKIANDAVERLEEFTPEGKDEPGVKAHAYYHRSFSNALTSGYTGEVTIHAEDVLAMVREIEWRREAMGDI